MGIFYETIKKEKMRTFQSLFKQYTFDEILLDFQKLYRKNEPGQADHLNWEGYRAIYQSLQNLKKVPSDCHIYVASRWERMVPMIDMNCSVREKRGSCGPVAVYLSWPEIVGMKVYVRKGVEITPQELVAGLFWEITYYGGSEEMVRNHLENRTPDEVITAENGKTTDIYIDKKWSL